MIEVGVDVPAATVMVIEHAERFGLAQLHQLRGRVGRGTAKSTCLLLYAQPLGETAKARLAIMRETEDGFRIAEEDLRLRGAGELLGTRQSGLPDMRLADLAAHGELLQAARDDARLVIERDPDLQSERGAALRALLYLFRRDDAVRTLRAGYIPSSIAGRHVPGARRSCCRASWPSCVNHESGCARSAQRVARSRPPSRRRRGAWRCASSSVSCLSRVAR